MGRVCFGMRKVIQSVVGRVPGSGEMEFTSKLCVYVPFQRLYAIRRKLKHVQAPITNKTIVRRGCYRNPVVEPRRILDRIALEALCSVLEHVARRLACRLGIDTGPLVLLCLVGHIMGRATTLMGDVCSLVAVEVP
jgi:hypothetical protein